MSESQGREKGHDPRAGRILALHAEHRKGLHVVPLSECIQCTFDGLRSGPDAADRRLRDPKAS
jgi:hypothetical protein